MHKNGYVVAVMANGNVLEEDGSSKIALPFGTEYKVRLINKNYDRCAADLIINGDKIARFILNAGETADIERYVDGNLNSGNRFKFTHLHDSKVKDAGSFENGIVEVLYFKEKYQKKEPVVVNNWPNSPYYFDKPRSSWGAGPSYGASAGSNLRGFGSSPQMSCNFMAMASAAPAEGATVRGSESDQKFASVSGLEFESTPVIIKLKIVNGELQSATRYCTGCGRKKNSTDKFCANCGIKY